MDNNQYFNKDGIHFSESGWKMYGDLLNTNLYTQIISPVSDVRTSVRIENSTPQSESSGETSREIPLGVENLDPSGNE